MKLKKAKYQIFIPQLRRWEFVTIQDRDSIEGTNKAAIANAFENMGCTVVSIKQVVPFVVGHYDVVTDMDSYTCSVGRC